MTTDELIDRLRQGALCEDRCRVMDAKSGCTCAITAGRIAALQARVAELEAGLIEIDNAPDAGHWCPALQHARDIARALLAKPTGDRT